MGEQQWQLGNRIRAFILHPAKPRRRPRKRSPMWRRSIPTERRATPSRSSTSIPRRLPSARSSVPRRSRTRATSSITSAGTRAPPASARNSPTRMSSGATSSSPGCAPRASTSSTPSPTRAPRKPQLVKTIEPAEIAEKTGYTRPHTIHCGPGGIYVVCLGNKDGKAPGGIFVSDQETFEPLGRCEVERGPQQLSYDGWWHLGYDTMVTSEWGTPDTFENGLVPEVLLGSKYGRRLHFWDFTKRKHLQEIDFGEEHQLVFELRPAHDPTKPHGFVNCVISLKDLSSSIWTWYRDGDKWAVKKIISIA